MRERDQPSICKNDQFTKGGGWPTIKVGSAILLVVGQQAGQAWMLGLIALVVWSWSRLKLPLNIHVSSQLPVSTSLQ